VVYARPVTEQDQKGTRREQRRAKQADSTSAESRSKAGGPATEQIRDRNARLRERAAAERRARRAEREAAAAPMGLDASERVDDLLARSSHAVTLWLRNNFRWLQWVLIIAVLGGFAWLLQRYRVRKAEAGAGDALMVGNSAQSGTVGDSDTDSEDEALRELDVRPQFRTDAARLSAAAEGYRKALAGAAKSGGAAWLAKLGLAGVLYDEKSWDAALELYRSVRSSKGIKEYPELYGRALEGVGLCLDAKGDRDGALQAFRELTNQEGAPSLSTLGLFQQARVLLERNDKDKAKQLALKAEERLTKDKDDWSQGYLLTAVHRLLSRIDPSLAKQGTDPGSLQELLQRDPERLQQLLKQMRGAPEPEPAVPEQEVPSAPPDTSAPEEVPSAPAPAPSSEAP